MKQNMGRNFVAMFVISCAALAGRAEADSITFLFDYYTLPPHVDPHTPIGTGSYGTLTLSDSAVDPNRVDITLTATPLPAYATGSLEQFYINFATPFLTNHKFYLVPVNAAAGPASSNTPYPTTLGTVGYTNGVTNYNFANFVFDLNPNPTSGALTFTGSLALYDQLPNPDQVKNLDVGMFDLTSGGTNSPPMYAGYRLTNVTTDNALYPNFPDGEFFAFASVKQTDGPIPVPEPATLLLLGAAAAGAAASARRKPGTRRS